MPISHRELFQAWRDEPVVANRNAAVLSCVINSIGLNLNDGSDKCKKVKRSVSNLCSKFNSKWTLSNRTIEVFERRNNEWLDKNLNLDPAQPSPPSETRRGRPSKTFSESKFRSQMSKVSPLVHRNTNEELMLATRIKLYKSGKRHAASLLQDLDASPTRALQIRKAVSCPPKKPVAYTPEEALALYVDGGLTKNSYLLMQSGAKSRNANIYPPYNVLHEAKKRCYPHKDAIKITDISAEVKVQSMVDHTVRRIIDVQKDVFEQSLTSSPEGQYVEMTYKWGCDGSGDHSTYRQKFSQGETTKTDDYLFAICIVPLQLKMKDKIIWQNPRPSSTRFCRPLKLIYEKESSLLIKKETEAIKEQINNIIPTQIQVGEKHVNVKHRFCLTMIDGKTFSAIAESSNQSCGICGATPKIMNDLKKLAQLKPKESLYEYGLSTLHAWIRCFECVLHIAYRLDSQKWQIRSYEEKQATEARKKRIIDEMKQKMHLLVDIPKPGFGTTNDGNTARRFFQNSELASSITGVDEHLIRRLGIVLRTMACGYRVNINAFREYTLDTAKLFVENYPWYYMPASLHKILFHGPDIVDSAVLPIGMLSEEAMESRNKDFRNYREFHTRKMSREQTMTDLVHTLLYTSDPVISSISRTTSVQQRSSEPLTDELRNLLSDPHLPEDVNIDNGDRQSSSDSES